MKVKFFCLIISINGQRYKIFTSQPITILSIINLFNYQQQLNLIEYNGKIKNILNLNKIYIINNAKIEMITIVGGG
ncbi:unnamed protein product [Sphacelaria rigidula]